MFFFVDSYKLLNLSFPSAKYLQNGESGGRIRSLARRYVVYEGIWRELTEQRASFFCFRPETKERKKQNKKSEDKSKETEEKEKGKPHLNYGELGSTRGDCAICSWDKWIKLRNVDNTVFHVIATIILRCRYFWIKESVRRARRRGANSRHSATKKREISPTLLSINLHFSV